MRSIRNAMLAGALCLIATMGHTFQSGPWHGHGDPTAEEQYLLELLNHTRADPLAVQKRLGVDLTERGRFQLAPRHPLALNHTLMAAARGHSRDMNDQQFFSHRNLRGDGPGDRIRAAGYPWTGYSENLAAFYPSPATALEQLLVDEEVTDRGHRISLLGLSERTARMDEVGIGIHSGNGPYKKYYTISLAADSDPSPCVVGVAYRDSNRNRAYDPGEGLPGIRIQIGADGPETVTASAGGYAVRVEEPGSYVLTASGAALGGVQQSPVTVGNLNVKVDFTVSVPPTPPGTRALPRLSRRAAR